MRASAAKRFRVPATAAFIFALAAVGALSRADLIPGGGPPASDCYIEFNVQGGTSNKIACTDGDPACDSDNQCQDTCTFRIALCVNQSNVSGCTPKSFKRGPRVSRNLVPVPTLNGASSACGAFTDVTVDVKVKRNGRKKARKLKIKANGTVDGRPKSDKDTLNLTCMPRTGACPTTTTTTSSTTTTTTLAPPSDSLAFTTSPGTADCGPAGLTAPPAAPFSGEIDSDTAGTTKIADLGLGCLYIGGGGATTIPPGKIPDAATNYLAISGTTLSGSDGTGPDSCTKGAGPNRHCVNQHCNTDADCDGSAGSCEPVPDTCRPGTQPSPLACTTDLDCGGAAGSCALDANCDFGPPLPILSPPPFNALTTCVINVIQQDATGTVNTATGESTVSLPLSSRVYITGNSASPCPKCVSGTCNAGGRSGMSCTPVGTLQTTRDCPPNLSGFQAPLPVTLSPLTTGTSVLTDASGSFCPSQANPGAFGQPTARRIAETGSPGGDLTDGNAHDSVLASVFCIPATGAAAVDGVADLPGPGAIGLNGSARVIQ